MPKVVSLFSGAGGLDWGFKEVGFEIVFANDVKPCYLGLAVLLQNLYRFPDDIPPPTSYRYDLLEVVRYIFCYKLLCSRGALLGYCCTRAEEPW